MPESQYTVEDILKALGRAFSRVGTELGNPGGAPAYTLVLLRRLGWNVPLDATIGGGASAILNAAAAMESLVSEGEIDVVELVTAIRELLSRFGTIGSDLDVVASAEFRDALERELPAQLRDFVLVRFLESEHPRLNALLAALGVIYSGLEEAEPPHRLAYVRKEVRWDVLRGMLSEPALFARHAFGWGTPSFDGARLLDAINLVSEAFDLEVSRFAPNTPVTDTRVIGGDPLFFQVVELPELSIGAELYVIRNEDNSADLGLALAPYVASEVETEVPVSDSVSFGLSGSLRMSRQIGVELTPDGLSVFGIGAPPPPTGIVTLSLIVAPADGILTVGDPAGTHFTIPKLSLRFPINIASGSPDVGFELSLDRTQLVLAAGGADSFLGKILGDKRVEGQFDLGIGIDRKRGLYLIGSGGFEVEIPLHRSLGPLTIQSIFVGFAVDGGRFSLSLAASVSAQLGPVAAAVSHFGVQIVADTANNAARGLDLGPVHLLADFLPPDGGGLSLSAGPVTGGGFIKHDKDAGSYSGILDLKFTDIGLVAVAIITTKLPGGKKGFALFINIGVTFNPSITLPYLFYLSGCGGLCAVNRTMDTEALRSGLRNKTLDSILFPADPIKNASKIISDSERVFPIEEGRFVIGPMAKLGWGTGGLVTANIAIVLELPAPIVIALLGQVKVRVPQSEESKVKLNLDILGVLEIEKKSLSFDATLYDSKVLIYELYGDAALRLRWGSSPQFAMSVGGFHPKFTPPANFPSLRRLTIALRSTSSFELSATMYHALTSNTLQFGAKLRLYASACGASLEGHLSFDTLFQFSPFEFDVGISGGLSARFHGRNIASVKLSLDLSGPTPWHAKGKAKVSVLCWDVTARFSKTWGSDDKARVAKVDPLPPFLEELEVVGNWSAALSPRRTIVETLKSLEAPLPPSSDETPDPAAPPVPDFLVHPAGALAFRQRLLPLDMKLEKFKSADVKTHFKFDVRMDLGPTTAAPTPTETAPCLPPGISLVNNEVKEHFAKAQFKSLSKSDRLSRPSYEKFRAGLEVGPGLARVDGCVQECELEYESILIMPEGTREETKAPSRNWAVMKRALRIAALRRASMRHRRRGKFAVAGPGRVGLKDEAYVVVDKATLTRATHVQPLDAPPINQTQALDLLDAAVADHLVAPGAAIVVPEFEEVTA